MKYVYILVSDDGDYYYEQALMSIASLKVKTPDAFISLLIDDITEKTLIDKRRNILEFINELKVIKIESQFNKKARSRWLKTSMRQHIKGDFLYIDCDTIIAENLSELAEMNIKLGGVLDSHCYLDTYFDNAPYMKTNMQALDERLGFVSIFKSRFYCNGGILFCSDSPIVYDFFSEWHRLWLFCFSQGVITDQQSLNQTNYSLGGIITELNGIWNCQILCDGSVAYLHNAKIIHYYAVQKKQKPYLLANETVFQQIKLAGKITTDIKSKLDNPKNLFSPDTRLSLFDKSLDKFTNSATYAAAKHLYNSKLGNFAEKFLDRFRQVIFIPITRKLVKS